MRWNSWVLGALLGAAACGGEPDAASTSSAVTPPPEVVATPAPPVATPEARRHPRPVELQPALDALVRESLHGGGVLRIGTPDGVLFSGGSGTYDDTGNRGSEMTPDTLFDVAGLTRMFVAVATLQLIEEGKLTLDARLTDVLPATLTQGLLQLGATDQTGAITIRELLLHTSGLPDYWMAPGKTGPNGFLVAFNADPQRFWEPREILPFVKDLVPAGQPGAAHVDSDTNYLVLGLVIEQLDGQPLQASLRKRILERVGLRQTYFAHREDPPVGAVLSHRFEGTRDLTSERAISAEWGSGGLVSTTADLERFMFELLAGHLFASRATLDRMVDWQSTGSAGLRVGFGLYEVQDVLTLWGDQDLAGPFLYYWPARNVVFSGTLNQSCDFGDCPGEGYAQYLLIDTARRLILESGY